MLEGMPLEDNPLLSNPAQGQDITIVYQDDAIVVVNKPAEFLSVPGVHVHDSVLTRLKAQFTQAEGVFALHRLDMSTSGLLVFALTRRANKQLQKQFISRAVQKRYVALIEGKLSETQGEIQLPLCGDLDDRPRQKCAGSKVSLHSLIGKPCKWSKTELVFTSTHIQDVPINCEYIAPIILA